MPSSNARTHRKRLARAYAARYGIGYQQAHQRIVAAHQAGALPASLSALNDADLDAALAAAHAHTLTALTTLDDHTESTGSALASSLTDPAIFSSVASDPGLVACLRAWDDTENPDSLLMDEVAAWAGRLLAASEDDRPGYDRLEEAAHAWDDHDEHDPDACDDIVDAIRAITSRHNMRVVEDGHGGHVRAADGLRAHTCPWCGNGYATAPLMAFHLTECSDNPDESQDPSPLAVPEPQDWKHLLSNPHSAEFRDFLSTCAPGDALNLTTVASNLAHSDKVVVFPYPDLMACPADGFITEPVDHALDNQGHLTLRDIGSGRTRTYKFGSMDARHAHADLHRVHPDGMGLTLHHLDGTPSASLRAAFEGDALITVLPHLPALAPRRTEQSRPKDTGDCDRCGKRVSLTDLAAPGVCADCAPPFTATGEIDVAASIKRGLIDGFDTSTWHSEQTWTLVGHWEGNTIVVEYALAGEVQDERPETGYWSEGLWASSAAGTSMAQIAAHALNEYEECHRIVMATSDDQYTPSSEDDESACVSCGEEADLVNAEGEAMCERCLRREAGPVCEICGEPTDLKDTHGTLMCSDCQAQ